MSEPHNKLMANMSWEEICDKIMDDVGSSDPKFKQWLLSKESNKQYCFNSALYHVCYQIYVKINNDKVKNDHFVVVVGKEGSGKSTLALQMSAIIDPSFNIERICYSAEDFIKRTLDSKPGQVYQIDEGSMMLFSRQTMSKGNINLVQIVQLMRQLRLCTIICIPTFEQLDSYIRRHRIDTLIEVFPGFKYRCVNSKNVISFINNEIRKGFKLHNVQLKAHHRFLGYFNKDFPLLENMDWEDYERLKRDKYVDYVKEVLGTIRTNEGEKKRFVSTTEFAAAIGYTRDGILAMIKRGDVKAKRLGQRYLIPEEEIKRVLTDFEAKT